MLNRQAFFNINNHKLVLEKETKEKKQVHSLVHVMYKRDLQDQALNLQTSKKNPRKMKNGVTQMSSSNQIVTSNSF